MKKFILAALFACASLAGADDRTIVSSRLPKITGNGDMFFSPRGPNAPLIHVVANTVGSATVTITCQIHPSDAYVAPAAPYASALTGTTALAAISPVCAKYKVTTASCTGCDWDIFIQDVIRP